MRRITGKRLLVIIALIIILLPVSAFFILKTTSVKIPNPFANLPSNAAQDVEKAIRQAIEERKEGVPMLMMFNTRIENIMISEDGNWATAWLTPVSMEDELVVATEPGLAIAQRESGAWVALLPSDTAWSATLHLVPAELLTEASKSELLAMAAPAIAAATLGPYSGYWLPWPGGETMYLTQSLAHDYYTPSGNAHFAFDFAKGGAPSGMWNVHAAKAGFVKYAVWKHPNGNTQYANYLVLEDPTTIPTTYQLYLHFAQDSIPVELRTAGTPVARGQYIGVADDTGVSSGNHLHFMVHTTSYSYWGTSVDITFSDVAINGGRPRIKTDLPYCKSTDVCDTTQYGYVSGNFWNPDQTPPVGEITQPLHNSIINTNSVHLSGWAQDTGSGLASAQFIARFYGSWYSIGSVFNTSPFEVDWDMCSMLVPDGPISLALQLTDLASNKAPDLTGLIHFTKNYTCPPPPPTCVPDANQVALFADVGYSGACTLLTVGSYPSPTNLGAVGADNATSIQVGSNVQATLFSDENLTGRAETFINNDSNLSDNRIGSNTLSSMLVALKTVAPNIPLLVWPANNATPTSKDSFSLVAENSGNSTEFQARWTLNGQSTNLPWQPSPAWHLNSFAAGSYTWQVRARNASTTSDWSATRAFVVQATTDNPVQFNAPYSDSMESGENGWNAQNWAISTEQNHSDSGSFSWKYNPGSLATYETGLPNSGTLTSPSILIPNDGQTYFARFWYRYETESDGVHWDQRWIQISVNGGSYSNLIQLSDDPTHIWLQSPAIPLAPYAGQRVQLRFYFASLDNRNNSFKGWYIDDFSITINPPPNCSDTNNNYTQAIPIGYNTNLDGVICPGGDIDYYQFQGSTGDKIGIWVQAKDIGSNLDPYLFLLDADGRSVLAENDDQVLAQRTDSWVYFQIPRNGTYYIKIRAWAHPSVGGSEYFYKLHLFNDSQDPQAYFIYPVDGGGVALAPITLRVGAYDNLSGVSRVQFFWHTSDWKNSDWVYLGEDWDGGDGWNFSFDLSSLPTQTGIAFYARVIDWAGNWIGIGAWNLTNPKIIFPLILKQ